MTNFEIYYSSELFLKIKNGNDLCKLLNSPAELIQNSINNPIYQHFKIPKKKGGHREIFAPDLILKKYQQQLNYYLQSYYYQIKPFEVHGFVKSPKEQKKNCPIVENAKVHTNQAYVLNIDIKDYFPSISAKSIFNLFQSDIFNFPTPLSQALALLCTYQGKLPAGAPTSPVLSNFIFLEIDFQILQFSNDYQINYSRYADDLSFSSNDEIPDTFVDSIEEILNQNGFKINSKKVRLLRKSTKQTVTGLVVNEKVNVDRKYIRNIRAILHDCDKNGILEAVKRHYKANEIADVDTQNFYFKLKGKIDFIGQVRGKNDAIYLNFKDKFEALKF